MKKGKFLNIFSRKKQRIQKSKTKIIVDYREKSSSVPDELEKNNFKIKFKNLKVADYLVNGVAIERKTVSDFISSMINKRLVKQLKEIQQYPKRLLMIEGIEEQELYSEKNAEELTGMHPNAIRGFLLSILIKYNVPIIFTKNYKDTVKFMKVLSKKKKTDMPLNVNKKTLNKQERLQFILEGFPGIGPKTSKKLLKEFKTIENIFNASLKDLKEVIGKRSDTLNKLKKTKYTKY